MVLFMTAWAAHVTVATVVEKNGKFLFVEEHSEGFTHPVFNQPAGHVEAGETLVEAAIRETREETGHDIQIDHLLGIYTYTPRMFPDRTYFRFCFLAHIVEEHPHAKLDTGIIQATWLSFDELQNSGRARSPLVIQAIQDSLTGHKYPLSMIHEHPFSPNLTSNLDA